MTGYHGWAGTVLNIDLTTGEVRKEPLSRDFARSYLGASGFNSARLLEMVGPEVDALDPQNVLLFGVGPLTGTLAPGGGRLTVTAKSPLTDIFGDANMGGSFPTELKFAGYDQIVITGKAKAPAYLWIDDGEVEMRDASHLWGSSTWDTARRVREDAGDPALRVIAIGQAGENLVRYANIIEPTRRAAGRTGMGAVMGSKNLKAIAVRGSGSVAVARPGEFIRTCREIRDYVVRNSPGYPRDHTTGSPGLMEGHYRRGTIAVRNFQGSLFPFLDAVSGKTFVRDYSTAHKACPGCFVACSHFHMVRSGEFAGVCGEGPEFGLTGIAPKCEIDSLPALLKMNELFNQYGMDCGSAGQMLAWAMDCYERGVLGREVFDGRPLSFGDYHACIEWIPRIARREGFGNVLAEGEKRVPVMAGNGSGKFMYHVKGMSFLTQDPRADKQLGLQELTSPRGADHLKGLNRATFFLKGSAVGKELWANPEILDSTTCKGKGTVVKWCEDTVAAVNSSGMCLRTCGSITLLVRLLSSATGIEFTEEELLQIGERVFNTQKAFNSRLGLTREDDNFSVPEKFTDEPLAEGPNQGKVCERDVMLDEYYRVRGWDVGSGLQSREKLAELGLESLAEELAKVNAAK